MDVTLHFSKPGYIAHPYWPEQYKLIQIIKVSGMSRTRNEANRRRALQSHLEGIGMSLDEFEQLKIDASRPFHTNGKGHIIIPADKILSALVNGCNVASAALRVPNLRNALRSSDFHTDRKEPDGVWERFAVVTGAQGKLSNERALRSNAYICDFDAKGTIEYDPQMVEPKAIVALLDYTGRSVGIGASRKMGWGRFTVSVNGK
jgi:hypothetical protein